MKTHAQSKLMEALQSGYTLPSLSAVAMKLVELAADERSSAADLTRLITRDPALSARLLRLANSAYFYSKTPIASLQQAITRVGFHRLRVMALSLSLQDSFPMKKVGPMNYEKFWRASIYRALLTSSLAKHLNLCDAEEAFVAGLTLEIGLLVFFDIFIKGKIENADLEKNSLEDLLEWEHEISGINHRQIGEEVLVHWNFPDEIINCQMLYRLKDAKSDTSSLAKLTSQAMELTSLVFVQPENYQTIFAEANRQFGLTSEVINDLLQDNFNQIQDISDSLLSRPSQTKDMLDLMAKAHETLGKIVSSDEQHSFEEEIQEEASDPNLDDEHASDQIQSEQIMFGRYTIEKKLGKGGMGQVYLANDNNLTRKVAIKTLRLSPLKKQSERRLARSLFLQEARVTGNLNHPHITTIYDMGIDAGSPYLIMEYIEGRSITDLGADNLKLSLREKLSIISMVARALNHAHEHGILHRDIKPANIMILNNGLPKITDFGIARIIEANSSMNLANIIDKEEGFSGTPGYMSPEQVLGKELDQRSDIFSLGVLAYRWISTQKPFKGNNIQEVFEAIRKHTPPPLSKISKTGKRLEKIINRAIEKDPTKRYQNAEEFSDALERFIEKARRKTLHKKKTDFSYDKKEMLRNLRKKYRFFSNFSTEEMATLFKIAVKEKFDKGDYIIQQGTVGNKLFIIVAGSIVVSKKTTEGKNVEVFSMSAGSCFGEMSIVDRMPRSASIIAQEPTKTISINDSVLRQLQPRLSLRLYRNLASIISERLRDMEAKYLG